MSGFGSMKPLPLGGTAPVNRPIASPSTIYGLTPGLVHIVEQRVERITIVKESASVATLTVTPPADATRVLVSATAVVDVEPSGGVPHPVEAEVRIAGDRGPRHNTAVEPGKCANLTAVAIATVRVDGQPFTIDLVAGGGATQARAVVTAILAWEVG